MDAIPQLLGMLIFLWVGGSHLVGGVRMLLAGARSVPVPGTVVEVGHRRRSWNRRLYAVPVVEYLDAGGARHRATPRWYRGGVSYRTGQQLQVYADPRAPGLVLLGRRDGLLPALTGALVTAVGLLLAAGWAGVLPEVHLEAPTGAEPVLAILGGVFVLVGGTSVAVGAVQLRRIARSLPVEATVVSVRWRHGHDGRYQVPTLGFTDADGHPHTVEPTIASTTARYRVGDRRTVYYDPQRPGRVAVARYGGVVFAAVGAVFLVVGLGFTASVLRGVLGG